MLNGIPILLVIKLNLVEDFCLHLTNSIASNLMNLSIVFLHMTFS